MTPFSNPASVLDFTDWLAMGSTLLQESWAVEVGSREPWAEDSKLYQPIEETQAQCNEKAQSLAVQGYLRMCGLDHVVEQRPNAEFISPTGSTPVLQCGSFVLADLESIVGFVASKGICLTSALSAAEKADHTAYYSLVQTVLHNAELYFSWVTPESYEVTWTRYGSVYPWPLTVILPWLKRRTVLRAIKEWTTKPEKDVLEEIDSCLFALSERLAGREWFFGTKPTELDALVFGHLYVLVGESEGTPGSKVSSLIRKYDNLIGLCARINKTYFKGTLT